MRAMKNHWAIAVDITSRCIRSCAHCTRCVRQIKQRDANLDDIEDSLKSLKGWGGGVVCIGGEPSIHRQWVEVKELFREYVPTWRAALFTAKKGAVVWAQIENPSTFGVINFNDHYEGSWHQPVLVSGLDLPMHRNDLKRLRDRCWLNWHWCPVIRPGVGAYFCEVAASIDQLMSGGKNAMPLEPYWWMKGIPNNQAAICYFCGIMLNLPSIRDTSTIEYLSWFWVSLLKPPVNSYKLVESQADFPADKTPRHYAKRDGIHHFSQRTRRIWLRQKWFGAGYHIRKGLLWPVQDILTRKA